MPPPRVVLQPGRVSVRHIKLGTGPGQRTILGRTYVPTWEGLNGPGGFASGTYQPQLGQEGEAHLVLPNAPGPDGVLHRQRFKIITDGAVGGGATGSYAYTGGTYRPGDEFIEVWHELYPEPILVFTPTQAQLSMTAIELVGYDAMWLLKKQRETASGFWCHAPRDVWEQYTRAWQALAADDFSRTPFSYSTAVQTAYDWQALALWSYANARNDAVTDAGSVRLIIPGPGTMKAYVGGVNGLAVGGLSADPEAYWRLEATLRIQEGAAPVYTIQFGLADAAGGTVQLGWQFLEGGATSRLQWLVQGTQGAGTGPAITPDPHPGPHYVAIEGRGRWLYFYYQGQLRAVLQMTNDSRTLYPQMSLSTANTDTYVYVDEVLVRRLVPYLMRGAKGDYHLPGAPPPGGLIGSYYSDADLANDANRETRALEPTRQPYARRLDPAINFTSTAAPPAWLPPGGTNYWSARWKGCIRLLLAQYSGLVRLRLTSSAADSRLRLWCGATYWHQRAEGAAGATATLNVSSLLPAVDGWYPLVVEYVKGSAAGATVVLQYSTDGGTTWLTVPSLMLSPFGVHEEQVRNEAFYDQLQALQDTYGLQTRVVPRQLEHAAFPGELAPYVRVGRDTERVIEVLETTDVQSTINAEGTADAIQADASGVSDQKQQVQLTAEGVNYSEIVKHPVVTGEYQSLSDITDRPLLLQRITSLLALYGSSWQEVQARPEGRRELLDNFPLTGALAEFYWQPGDGVRIQMQEIAVYDTAPRQLQAVQRSFYPDGLGRPSVSFTQRPRSLGAVLRQMRLDALRPNRNYQGQLAVVTSNWAGSPAAGAMDEYARVPLPYDITRAVQATLVVGTKTDASSWNVEVNGVVRQAVIAPGRYDIAPYIQSVDRGTLGGQNPYTMRARMLGGTGSCQYWIELLVRV